MSEFANFEPIFKETYTLILSCLKKSCIYIMDESSLERKSFVRLVVYILAMASHTGGVLDRIHEGADFVQLSGDLSAALILWQTILLYIQLYANRKLIKNLIMNLGMKWRTDDQLRPEMVAFKHKSMKSFYKWIAVFYKILTTYTLLYLSQRFLYVIFKLVILKQEVALITPFRLKAPFAFGDNFILYCIMYLADCKILLDIAYLVTYDLLLMNATMHQLRLMFVMLQDDFDTIKDVDQTTAVRRLRKFIPEHAELLKLMPDISKAFGRTFMIHLAFFSGTICFFCFAARVQCSPESLQNALVSTFVLICIYKCCSYGQHLTDASMNIAEAAYNSPWYFMSSEYRSSLILIILRSQKTQNIKATSFTDVSLQSFTKILNATWSFLSVITNMYEA